MHRRFNLAFLKGLNEIGYVESRNVAFAHDELAVIVAPAIQIQTEFRDLLKTFADQTVIAIENVRLFRAEQQRTCELNEALELDPVAFDLDDRQLSIHDLRVVGLHQSEALAEG